MNVDIAGEAASFDDLDPGQVFLTEFRSRVRLCIRLAATPSIVDGLAILDPVDDDLFGGVGRFTTKRALQGYAVFSPGDLRIVLDLASICFRGEMDRRDIILVERTPFIRVMMEHDLYFVSLDGGVLQAGLPEGPRVRFRAWKAVIGPKSHPIELFSSAAPVSES